MHEFVITLEKLKHEKDVSALDVAKALLDHGMHPPTMYFPLIVHEALMVEPTEDREQGVAGGCRGELSRGAGRGNENRRICITVR